ncbi:Ubiquitin carboxyl-terminal hydrolase 14 [Phlyctochytrium planicorne]|nr:Ubiquitin carboxyl-terminal hydrolase 14 [Phlyctochytrium planicorne]
MPKIVVKWSGNKYDVDVDPEQTGAVFKMQLFSLTNVEPDRQKILVKGGVLKARHPIDDLVMGTLGLKEGQTLMMMGTAGELPKEPASKPQFIEDMTDSQLNQALKVPPGLKNMGNTCYMNATLQCLRSIPDLQLAISKAPQQFSQNPRYNLVPSLGNLFGELASSGDAVQPFGEASEERKKIITVLVFLQILRQAFPQFAEANNHGFLQQDAEECWGEMISAIADKVPAVDRAGNPIEGKKFVDQYLSGETISEYERKTRVKCDDAPAEPATTSLNSFRQLKVNIGAGVSTYMLTDLQQGFTEKIEKNSESLGRTAIYTQVSKISRLPKYLTINFVRFQWKPTERVKAKILKMPDAQMFTPLQKVKFPFDLDMTGLCTTDLQEKLAPAKNYLKDLEEKKAEAKKLKKAQNPSAMDVDEVKPVSDKDELTICKEIGVSESLYNDAGASVSGQYDLVAVLTHVGRAADSGHYIGWAKDEKGQWWKYDDDDVSLVNAEEITKLEGGGDWHTAYIILYREKSLLG